MGRICGLFLIVAGIWVGIEIYTEGLGGAFDGALARAGLVGSEGEPSEDASLLDRVRGSAERSRDEGMARYDSQLEE